MSTLNLDALFKPQAVVLVGASTEEGSPARSVTLALGESAFDGELWFINRNYQTVNGVTCYPGFKQLPGKPDLVIVTAPPRRYVSIAESAAKAGARALMFVAAPDSLGRSRSRRVVRSLKKLQQETGIRILGPNCHGLAVPGLGLHASFSRATPLDGRMAFIAQSGGVATSVVDWASNRGIGFSAMVALGDRIDLDETAALDYFAEDPDSDAILLYLENIRGDIRASRRFLSALRAAARIKPVVVMKAERFREPAADEETIQLHPASQDDIYAAALRRAGALKVDTLSELFDAAGTLAANLQITGDHLAILANGHGLSVLGEDALISEGGQLAELNPKTEKALRKLSAPGRTADHPANIGHDADASRYAKAIELLKADEAVDGILLLHTPNTVISPLEIAEQVVTASRDGRGIPVLANWLGDTNLEDARALFSAAGLPSYSTPNRAVRGFMHLLRYRQAQQMLRETPPAVPEHFHPDHRAARQIVDAATQNRRERRRLNAANALQLLAAYHFPVTEYRIARTPQEAAELSVGMRLPVAIKALTEQWDDKTSHQAVQLNLANDDAVRNAAMQIRERLNQGGKNILQGYLLQPMVAEPGSSELHLRAVQSEPFGPVIVITFGQIQTVALLPLNLTLAEAILAEVLADLATINERILDQLALCLVQLAQLMVDLPEVLEVSIDPLLIDREQLQVLDARVILAATTAAPAARLAICPYPAELQTVIELPERPPLRLRAVRPQDDAAIEQWFKALPGADIHSRFFHGLRVSRQLAARLAQVDYDREIAFLLEDTESGEIAAESRLVMASDEESAEFAVIVGPDYQGAGLGQRLIEHSIDYARQRGWLWITGEVLANNQAMLKLCQKTGFEILEDSGSPGSVSVRRSTGST